MGGDEYPKAMYRNGGDALIWGVPVATRTVATEDEELEAMESGWRLHPIHPLDHDGDGRKGGSRPRKER